MGLDNIPMILPCKCDGTAITEVDDDGEVMVLCKDTQEAGRCPWQNAVDRPTKGQVLGIMGSNCWYRGKYGNVLIAKLEGQDSDSFWVDSPYSFYGDSDEETVKSPQSCKDTADYMEDLLEESMGVDDETKDDAAYAIWWLRWVGNNYEGARCWY